MTGQSAKEAFTIIFAVVFVPYILSILTGALVYILFPQLSYVVVETLSDIIYLVSMILFYKIEVMDRYEGVH